MEQAGGTHAFDTTNHFMPINQMLLVGSTYWNMGYGWEAGEAAGDEEGMQNMQNLGENMGHDGSGSSMVMVDFFSVAFRTWLWRRSGVTMRMPGPGNPLAKGVVDIIDQRWSGA